VLPAAVVQQLLELGACETVEHRLVQLFLFLRETDLSSVVNLQRKQNSSRNNRDTVAVQDSAMAKEAHQ
jgi:hypothetical protein